MKKATIAWLTVLGVAALWTAPAVQAQDMDKDGARGVLAQCRLHRWNAMARWLQLTDEQKTRIKSIVENARQQARTIRDDTSLTREQKRNQLRELRRSTRQEIGSVLTPEQREKVRKWWTWRWYRWRMWRAYFVANIGGGAVRSLERHNWLRPHSTLVRQSW
jgi:Spy/CpxP family protein refolding chaperone